MRMATVWTGNSIVPQSTTEAASPLSSTAQSIVRGSDRATPPPASPLILRLRSQQIRLTHELRLQEQPFILLPRMPRPLRITHYQLHTLGIHLISPTVHHSPPANQAHLSLAARTTHIGPSTTRGTSPSRSPPRSTAFPRIPRRFTPTGRTTPPPRSLVVWWR